MPEVFPTRIISFSSEDKAFPACNLLKKSSFSKWKSEKGGSKQEFGQPVEFSRLDIGNNGSAFIEVLVRRAASSEEPTVRSHLEAKNETNLNRVRVFSKDHLSQNAINQKWDIVRLICSQPFNKTLQFGLSFVSFHSPTAATDDHGKKSATNALNPMTPMLSTSVSANLLKEDASSDPDLKPGSLFRAFKSTTSSKDKYEACSSPSVAEKIRAVNASSSPVASIKSATNTASPTLSTSNQSPSTRQPHPAAASSSWSTNPTPTRPQDSSGKKTGATPAPPPATSSLATVTASASKRRRTAGNQSAPLAGVIFSLSGYQNPVRSELRDKALRLGASFRQDWSDDCTHLVCAFPNTPKFNQVKGRGFIVSDKWITRCHETDSLVDWRPYRVGRAPSPKQPSSTSSRQTAQVSASGQSAAGDEGIRTTSPLSHSSETDSSPASEKKRKRTVRRRRGDNEDDEWRMEGGDSDEESEYAESEEDTETEDSEQDEEEEEGTSAKRKRRARFLTKKSKKRKHEPASDDDECSNGPEGEDTDDEIQRAIEKSLKDQGSSTTSRTGAEEKVENAVDLPDFFEGKHFFVHNKAIPSDEERLIRRLIVAFAGTLHPYMHPEVQFVVTRSSWSSEFDEALSANADLVFVLPDWILACDQEAVCLAHKDFLLSH